MVKWIDINNNVKTARVDGTALGKPGCLVTPLYSLKKVIFFFKFHSPHTLPLDNH